MRFSILLQIAISLAAHDVLAAAPATTDTSFQSNVVGTHNSDRSISGVPALTWSSSLAQYAQNWANNCSWAHSGGPNGENLYGVWTTGSTIDFSQQTISGINVSWYGEISQYDFNNPDYSAATGHFTQVVWKSTTQVGCAWNTVSCVSSGYNFFKFVCEYSPPGNIVGGTYFKDNVLRPLSASRTPSGTPSPTPSHSKVTTTLATYTSTAAPSFTSSTKSCNCA